MKTISSRTVVVAVIGLLALGVLIGYAANRRQAPSAPSTPVSPAPTPKPEPIGKNGCIVGGCSGELCSDEGGGPMMSPCIYRAEFACYKSAKCERQQDGACGWTPTPELKRCLQRPPALQ